MGARTWIAARGLAAAAALAASPALALQPVLHDSTLEAMPSGDRALVLRYLAPEVSSLTYDAVSETLDRLCEIDGLEAWAAVTPSPDEIVIVLMDRPVRRGTPDPSATQFMSAYGTEDGDSCQWQ